MASILDWLLEQRQLLVVIGGATVSLMALKRLLFPENAVNRLKRKGFPKNKVILVQVGRGPFAPSLSPFPLKVETYLRMAKIPYQNEHGWYFSSKGKTPFILYNGEEIPDSQFIIEFLNKEKGVDLNQHLSAEQKAIARAFLKMTEENLFWTMVAERLIYLDWESTKRLFPPDARCMLWVFRRRLVNQLWEHGIGRHSREEVRVIMEKDMRALSTYLGDKKFFFGDQPCETDCALFGLLAQFMWQTIGSPQEKLMKAPGAGRKCPSHCNATGDYVGEQDCGDMGYCCGRLDSLTCCTDYFEELLNLDNNVTETKCVGIKAEILRSLLNGGPSVVASVTMVTVFSSVLLATSLRNRPA